VTSIRERAFAFCGGLTSVSFGNSVRIIGEKAFYGCTGLTSLTIPNSVTYIREGAFAYCKGLDEVTIGSSVMHLYGGAFANCDDLKTVYCLAEKVPYTYDDAFLDTNTQNATLYVPATCLNDYKKKLPWNRFGTIRAIDDLTGVMEMSAQGQAAPYYTLDGRRITGQPTKGICIHNGRKVVVK
jgi:hypothetical protein